MKTLKKTKEKAVKSQTLTHKVQSSFTFVVVQFANSYASP